MLIIGLDYDKYGEEEGVATQITAIVVKEDDTGMIEAHVVKCKGPQDEWVTKRLCKDIEGLGRGEICHKTEGEPALVAVQSKIVSRRDTKTIPENPPAYDPKANGVIEKRNARCECKIEGNQNCDGIKDRRVPHDQAPSV